jgi:inosose dehydratase
MLDKNKIKLGIAPIAWTNDDMPDLGKENTFEQCISEMALAGYTGSEIGNKYPKDVATLKKALNLRGLTICNAWFSTFLLTKPYEETEQEFIPFVDYLAALGSKVVGVSEQGYSIQGMQDVPIFERRHRMNDEEWKQLCDGLNRLGKVAKEKGLSLTFHHHMGTVVQSAADVERLMEGTDPAYVNLLFDTGHLAYCNEEPLAILKRYGSRIKHVHLKDIRPNIVKKVKEDQLSFLQGVRNGAFTVPGDGGGVDFIPIFKELGNIGYEGYLLVEAEQDPAIANPLEYAIKARKYLRDTIGF